MSFDPSVNAALPSRSPTVLFREMDQGGVLFCSRTEVYFGLNPVGVKIWEQLPADGAQVVTFDDLLSTLQLSYPEVDRTVLSADAAEFLSAMVEGELASYEQSSSA